MESTRAARFNVVAVAVAFFGTLVIAAIALTFVFDSFAIAITPALAIAAALAFAVYLSRRDGKTIR
jgi:Na+-driven multidrug efflux pump